VRASGSRSPIGNYRLADHALADTRLDERGHGRDEHEGNDEQSAAADWSARPR